ncbi:MAG: DUF3316 domain-containing protein [Dysgonamonadaceae bacterium]|nr:DUF3316 domain-containing protein [Dysgonamonadaceae bacterium]
MKKIILHIIWVLSGALAGYAQEEAAVPLTYQSLSVGVGNTMAYDSYLSPLKYSGTGISLMGEQMKTTRLWQGRIVSQHLLHLDFADMENPSGSAISYMGTLEYDYGLFYRWNPIGKIRLYTGVQADLLAGVIYNSRNTNNPANAKANVNLNVSAMAVYAFQIIRQPILLRSQVNLPVVGALFSPEFGQSYYEIGLGDESPLIYWAAWHNRVALRSLFSLEVPLNQGTLRISYANRLYQTQVNDLKTKIVSGTVYVGVSSFFHVVSGKKIDKNKYRHVFE